MHRRSSNDPAVGPDLLVLLLELREPMKHADVRRMAVLEAMSEEAIHVIPIRDAGVIASIAAPRVGHAQADPECTLLEELLALLALGLRVLGCEGGHDGSAKQITVNGCFPNVTSRVSRLRWCC